MKKNPKEQLSFDFNVVTNVVPNQQTKQKSPQLSLISSQKTALALEDAKQNELILSRVLSYARSLPW